MNSLRTLCSLVLASLLPLTAVLCADSAQPQKLDGFWITDGYGYLFKIAAPRLEAYEITSISCIRSYSAKLKPGKPSDADDVFVSEDGDTLRVLSDTSPDTKLFHEDGATSSMVAHRVAAPPVFRAVLPNTPQENFDVFWQTFAEHYPFFSMKNVDWSALREIYRPQVKPDAAPQELFDVLKAMIRPLGDAHTFIAAKGVKKYFFGWRADAPWPNDQDRQRALEIVKNKYLRTPLREFCNGHLRFGMVDGSIGYLRVDAFEDYSKRAAYAMMVNALESALDLILKDAARMNGLVIDLRINDGGADPLGIAISSRLTERDYLAYTKEARIDPRDPTKWSPGQDSIVTASRKPHFFGPIVLLTGPLTVSAGETFAMSLMGRSPVVIRIGENTQGVFSDVLERQLPNGWSFGLPNERYLTADGRTFDGPGIPPDVAVAVFPQSDLQAGKDSAIEKALELLKRH